LSSGCAADHSFTGTSTAVKLVLWRHECCRCLAIPPYLGGRLNCCMLHALTPHEPCEIMCAASPYRCELVAILRWSHWHNVLRPVGCVVSRGLERFQTVRFGSVRCLRFGSVADFPMRGRGLARASNQESEPPHPLQPATPTTSARPSASPRRPVHVVVIAPGQHKRTTDRPTERTNERTNEQTNEQTNEGAHVWAVSERPPTRRVRHQHHNSNSLVAAE